MARKICLVLSLLVSGCGTFDFGDALATAAVFAEANDIKACQDYARETGDRWAMAACDEGAGW